MDIRDYHILTLTSLMISSTLFCTAEGRTDVLIDELMKAQRAQNDPQKVLEDMERERKDMEEMFTIKAGEAEKLREEDVLSKTFLSHTRRCGFFFLLFFTLYATLAILT
jgi:predicted nuclease with TOPRIM domain